MRKLLATLCCSSLLFSCSNLQNKGGGSDAEMDRFINDLMSKMTLEEKIGQLNLPSSGDITTGQAKSSNIAEKIKLGQVGGLFNIKGVDKIRDVQRVAVEESRLGIPLIFAMDVIHGYETAFPIPLGLSCTWNMDAIKRSAQVAAQESTADGISLTFSPMVDICRDPRWGRISEGNGEDPYLAAKIGEAMVKGYQGENLADSTTMMSCVKHFALYGAPDAGRDYNTVDMSRARMFNEYMYPYQAAIEAGAGSIMTSFNEIDGVPATANKWLLQDILRKKYNFKGFVMTDYTGINEMMDHGMGDLQTCSALAMNAGTDMDMVGEGFLTTLVKSVEEGKVSKARIDEACRGILEAKYKLGLFEDPYKYCDKARSVKEVYSAENRQIARAIAAESFVLLKNDNNTLPLEKKGTIAVIGPLGNNRNNMSGTWSVAVDASKPATLVEGIKAVGGDNVNVLYAKGSNVIDDAAYEERASAFGKGIGRDNRTAEQMIAEALQVARRADVIVAAVGELAEMSGESSSRTDITIPDAQIRLLKELKKTGKPLVVTLFTGRPLAIKWESENLPTILNVWFGGTEAAPAIADVLFGDVVPSGKLTSSFPATPGQVPIHYNHKMTGRPQGTWFEKFRTSYLDVDNHPLYPFGYGLSYTTFEYGDLKLDSKTMDAKGKVTASIEVKNTGKYKGAEVVQLYIRDLVGSVTRPVKELKGFEKITLNPGEAKTVSFEITPEMLKFYNYDLEYVFEAGDFDVMIGGNSRDVKRERFTLN
ncbi:MAG: beta-glucosidase BglX [Bacteroidales bacterium]